MAYWHPSTKYKSVDSPETYLNKPNFEFSCTELGSFSIDTQGNFYNNKRGELRSLVPDYYRKHGSDLAAGFDSRKELSHSNLDRPLDSFLHWIALNKSDISSASNDSSQARMKLDAEFVLTRATMKKLLATVFNTGSHKQPWKMYATKYNETIYISHEEECVAGEGPPREPKLGCRSREEEIKKILYMGKKLEEVISLPCEPKGMAEFKVDGRQGFYSVRKGRFAGRHLVLTRAEVDCIENGQYIECKLCLEYTGRDEWKFPMYKLRDWWYHMYAGDMKQVIYGIRDGPRLVRVSRVTLSEIPYQVQHPTMSCPSLINESLRSWNTRASIGFVDDFLQWLKGVVVEDNYGKDRSNAVQYALEWKIGSPSIALSRQEARTSRYMLLPHWYTNEMSSFFG